GPGRAGDLARRGDQAIAAGRELPASDAPREAEAVRARLPGAPERAAHAHVAGAAAAAAAGDAPAPAPVAPYRMLDGEGDGGRLDQREPDAGPGLGGAPARTRPRAGPGGRRPERRRRVGEPGENSLRRCDRAGGCRGDPEPDRVDPGDR